MTAAKLSAVLLCVAGAAFVLGQSVRPSTAEARAADVGFQPDDPMMQALAAMEAAGTPGPHHRQLDLMLGTWEGVMKWTMAPGTAPMEFRGRATREWVLDGRFIREEVTGDMPGGGAFQGLGFVGYNNLDHRYESLWLESSATNISTGHGTFNAAKKVFTFFGERRDPATGRVITMRTEIDCSDPNKEIMRAWESAEDGTYFQNVEGVFTRQP